MKSCVVLSTYNGEKYIIDQLESIRNQKTKVDAVFISDDCSTDNTVNFVKKYIKNNKLDNWVVERNTSNLGWKKNFAEAIKNVPKEYDVIFLCDQDDVWYNNKSYEMMKLFEKNKKIVLLTANVEIQYEESNSKKISIKKLNANKTNKLHNNAYNSNIRRPGCIYAVNRSMIQECFNNYNNESVAHDLLIWTYAYSKDGIYYIDKPLMKYRRLITSSTFMTKKSKRLEHKKARNKEELICLDYILNSREINNNSFYHLSKLKKLEEKRKIFFETRNLFVWLSCLKYIKYYLNIKMWIGDLTFMLIEKNLYE